MAKKRCKKKDEEAPKNPKFECENCGAEAKKKEQVCKPEKIKIEKS
jgi:hypothetical protein